MFSVFEDQTQNIPIGTLTLAELHSQLINPDKEPFATAANIVRGLRMANDEKLQKRIKEYLTCFTASSQLETKKADATPEQKNIIPSGFMQVDIDLKDNVNMKDAEAIRAKLAAVPYIALSALSARGQGVWGLLAIAEPDKLPEYAEQVYSYFKNARVTIDKSKSKNYTELRYFAPDSGAILKQKYELMPLLPKVKPTTRPTTTTKASGSTLADLEKWVTETTGYRFSDGEKHNFIYWLAYALRKNGTSEAEVYGTIHTNYLPADQIHTNCISGGIKHANDKGIYVPPTPQSTLKRAEIKPPAVVQLAPIPAQKPEEVTAYFSQEKETEILNEICQALTVAGISFSRSKDKILCSDSDAAETGRIFREVLYSGERSKFKP